jgi:dipeptidyl aminopeptidase/acylaminoacyl peptidase
VRRSSASKELQQRVVAAARRSLWIVAMALSFSVAGSRCAGAQNVSTPAVLSTESIELPSFAELVAGPRSPTEGESCCSEADRTVYERARADARFELLKLAYRSDELAVVAFVYRPKPASDRRPVVVYNRAGYVRQNAGPELLVPFHRFADAGFVVVAPMYRGSEGAPGHDEMGGADLADLMNIRAVIASLSYADSTNVFLYGESRGGMMVLQAIRDGFEARAAATIGAYAELDAYLTENPQLAATASQILPGLETNRDATIERRSAVRWASRISVPLLIMHGGSDTNVSPSHALRLASALQRAGKQYELAIVADARHLMDPYESERDDHAIRWFRRYLVPSAP